MAQSRSRSPAARLARTLAEASQLAPKVAFRRLARLRPQDGATVAGWGFEKGTAAALGAAAAGQVLTRALLGRLPLPASLAAQMALAALGPAMKRLRRNARRP